MGSTNTPDGLGEAGKRLWESVTADVELRADELRILEDAAREADLIEILDVCLTVDLKAGNIKTKGSMGQEVVNPLISEVRQHRTTMRALLAQLKLSDADTPEGRSHSARAAANARWNKRTG